MYINFGTYVDLYFLRGLFKESYRHPPNFTARREEAELFDQPS